MGTKKNETAGWVQGNNGGFGDSGLRPGDHPARSLADNPQWRNTAGRRKGSVNRDTEYRETFEAFRAAYREKHNGGEPTTGFWFMLEELNNPDTALTHKRFIAAHLLKYESRLPAQQIEVKTQDSLDALAGKLKARQAERMAPAALSVLDTDAVTVDIDSKD